jgi:hypothetical protein
MIINDSEIRHYIYPVRKPRCLPRVKLHFYGGMQLGWR